MIERGSAILVTGATGGIGFEIAAQAAESDAVIGVHGSTPASVEAAIMRLKQRAPAGRFIAAPANFAELGVIPGMVDAYAAEAERLDAVIDCAIVPVKESIVGVFADINPAAFGQSGMSASEVQAVCHAALPHLAKTGGAFVAFASDSGRFAAPRQSMVGAKQAAIIGFVRNIAMEVARGGVRVNCISPSFVEDTPIFERFKNASEGRAEKSRQRAGLGLPKPADIAPLALFLCGPGSAKITGQVISVNGGLSA